MCRADMTQWQKFEFMMNGGKWDFFLRFSSSPTFSQKIDIAPFVRLSLEASFKTEIINYDGCGRVPKDIISIFVE